MKKKKRGRPFKSFFHTNDMGTKISIKEFRHIETIKRKLRKLDKQNFNSIRLFLIRIEGGKN